MQKQLDAKTVINQAILDHPNTLTVFAKYGIDSCCGGAHTIAEATKAHKLDTDKVLTELREATERRA